MLERASQLLFYVLKYRWVEVFAGALFCFCVWRVLAIRPLEDALFPAVAALGGLICAVAPDEVSDWSGNYGWSTQQYRNYPPEFLRGFGVLVLIVDALYLG